MLCIYLFPQIETLEEQINESDASFEKESQQKKILMKKLEEIEEIKRTKEMENNLMSEKVLQSQQAPNRLMRQSETMQKAAAHMEQDLQLIRKKIFHLDFDIEKGQKRKLEATKLKKTLEEKLDLHRLTIEQREQEVAVLRQNLGHELNKSHDLITKKTAIASKTKDCDSLLRHVTDQHTIAIKEYEASKRYYKKKRAILDAAKQIIPLLETQLADEDIVRERNRIANEEAKQKLLEMRDELDLGIAKLLQQEGIEKGKKIVSINTKEAQSIITI